MKPLVSRLVRLAVLAALAGCGLPRFAAGPDEKDAPSPEERGASVEVSVPFGEDQ